MQININETEVMRVNNNRQETIQLQGKEIKEADSFTYLGSVVSKDRGTYEDIRNRINKARMLSILYDSFGEQLPSLYKTKLEFSVQM